MGPFIIYTVLQFGVFIYVVTVFSFYLCGDDLAFSQVSHVFLLLLFFSFQYMEVKERQKKKTGKAWEHLSHDVI